MRDALATAGLRRVQLSWFLGAVGSWGFFVVLAVYAYGEGGTVAVGIAALTRMVPAGLAAPLAGVLIDRRPRWDVLTGSLVLSAALLAAIAACVGAGAPLAVVLVLAAALTVVMSARRPAEAAMLPTLARTPKQLAAANAVWSALDAAAFLAGSLLSGAVIALASLEAAFGAGAALCGLGALVLLAVPRDPVPEHRAEESAVGEVEEALAGLRHVVAHRELRLVVGFLTLATVIEGAVDVLVVVVAIRLLDIGDEGVGWLNACWGAGGLAGGLAALGLLARGRIAAGLAGGGALVGLSLLGIAAFVGPVWAGLLLGLLGVGYALIEAAGVSLLQRLSSDVVLGRTFAVVESTYWLATGIGAMLAPPLVSLAGTRGALVALGAALIALVLLRYGALLRLEAGAAVPEREFAALRGLPLFAPLPIATVESVSRHVAHRRFAADRAVVVQGEAGEHFYVVAEGRVGVEVDGRHVRDCGPGECFGEIALLHAVPRTATVTAREESLLYALSRNAFLDAIGVHPSARRAADRTAAGHLARDRGYGGAGGRRDP